MNVLTLDQAADLAARTLAAITVAGPNAWDDDAMAADRERVASDLAGLRDCMAGPRVGFGHEGHALRYSDGLLRTASLYGVTP